MPIPKALRLFLLCVFLAFLTAPLRAQKVGVVLSGGGASGLAHIGVLKALEDNQIPIDCITGTSIGSLIGGLYAIGYSPSEIEALVGRNSFVKLTRGEMSPKFGYFLKKRNDYASWLTFKVSLNTPFITNIPTNIINSVPIDFYLMETFAGANARAHYNFDSLFVPFRCVASDIENKQSVIFRDGDLATSIRASMSYPFYLRPISANGKLLFDGGLYNNFPSDVMYDEFYPDFIIGSSVTENSEKPNDDNLYLQLRNMLMSSTNFNAVCENGIVIQPWADVNIFNFEDAKRLIDSGYAATVRAIPQIKKCIAHQLDTAALHQRRVAFKAATREENVVFNEVTVTNVPEKTANFIKRSINPRGKLLTMPQLRKQYFRLTADEKIKAAYPVAFKSDTGHFYKLTLVSKREKQFFVDIGGVVSNRPISEAYLGIQYNHVGRIGFTAYGNGYLGKLYSGGLIKTRFDFPARKPFYLEPSYTYSHWDYFRSSTLFYDFQKPAYLIERDQFGELALGLPVGNVSKFTGAIGYAEWLAKYYQTDVFTKVDTADASYFDFAYAQACFQLNTLNRKQYASDGINFYVKAKYVYGNESYYPGTTAKDTIASVNTPTHQWLTFKLHLDTYIKTFRFFRLGVLAEGVYSSQNFFRNYTASILSAPVFNPTPESQTLFLSDYHAYQYMAGGLKAIMSPIKNMDIRLEAYVFQPVYSIVPDANQRAEFSLPFLYRHYIGMAAMVYHTPVGPFSLGINYYDKNESSFSFFFHFGYTIFNRKSLD